MSIFGSLVMHWHGLLFAWVAWERRVEGLQQVGRVGAASRVRRAAAGGGDAGVRLRAAAGGGDGGGDGGEAVGRLPWAGDAGVRVGAAATRRAWRRERRREVVRFGVPALSTVLADPLMSVVDALCCGRSCGTVELASLGPALAVFNLANYLFFFLNAATTVRVTRALANGDERGAERELGAAVSVAALSGVAVGGCLFKFAAPLAAATGCVPELVPRAAAYLRVRGLGQPIVLAAMVSQAGLLAQRDARTPLDAVVVACVLNVAGDVALVPRLGAVGAAVATLASQAIALPALVVLAS